MAWLRDIRYLCIECGLKPSSVELLGLGNASYGKFCKSCGAKRLKLLLAEEARNARSVPPQAEKNNQ